MELIKVNPTDFGLTDETAQNIKDQFLPMLNKMVELEHKFNEVISMPIDELKTSKMAKDLRAEYRNVRKATEEIHKKQKAFYLNGGRYVDGWKNAQLFASQGKEEELKRIENYLEEMEKARVNALSEQRREIVKPYLAIDEEVSLLSLGVMDDDIFLAYVEVKKKAYNDRLEAEKIAKEQKEKELRIMMLKQQRSVELREYWMFMDEEVKTMNFGVMSDKYYEGMLIDLKRRKSEYQMEQQRLREENQAMQEKLRIEREEYAKKQAEFQEMQRKQVEKERALQQEKLKAEKEAKKLAKAPIKKQLMVWVSGFDIAYKPCDDEIAINIEAKFEAFKKWALQQVENM
jgi:hypothetical protein